MESLKGKDALVTGAGRGIGRAIAIALANERVNVELLGHTEKHLQNVAKEIGSEDIKTAVGVADISDQPSVETAVNSIQKELGDIDILINNAGIASFVKFLELEPAEWEALVKANLFGTC